MSQTFRALSLKSLQTTSNASTHTLFLSLGLEPTNVVGCSVQILFKGHKNQGVVFVQTANWIPVLTKFRKGIPLRIKSFHSSLKLLKCFQKLQKRFGFRRKCFHPLTSEGDRTRERQRTKKKFSLIPNDDLSNLSRPKVAFTAVVISKVASTSFKKFSPYAHIINLTKGTHMGLFSKEQAFQS